MSEEKPDSSPANSVERSEQEVDLRESELSASERALDARWTGFEQRSSILNEFRDYLSEREATLRNRALRLPIPRELVDSLLPPPTATGVVADNDMSDLAVAMQRSTLLDERWELCQRRQEALESRRLLREQNASMHGHIEKALLDREKELADAFRKLLEHATEAHPPTTQTKTNTGPPKSGAERRVHERMEMSAHVDFGTEHYFFSGATVDLGVGGVFIATPDLIREGRQIHLRLSLPGWGPLEVVGEVAWRRLVATDDGPPGLGIQFCEVDELAQAAIEEFVANRTSAPESP